MAYYIEYREYFASDVQGICVGAKNKYDAYCTALDRLAENGIHPYSAWVASVTYKNGNYHRFNTSEGNAY